MLLSKVLSVFSRRIAGRWMMFVLAAAGALSGLLIDCAKADDDFFEKQVRPLLVKRCYECHSSEKTRGGLSLESRSGWQRGGESGPAIVPGQPDESLLMRAVRYQDLEMPPRDKGGPLPDQEIAVLARWIAMGAPDPRIAESKIGGMSVEESRKWWSFQPLPPADGNASSVRIDEFLQQAQRERSLNPAPPTDRRTLIRRATYDLTGLPPTPAEVDAFLADTSEDAFSKVVERLLASPQYGVQWGRHWLDVVRYADTAGENTDRPLTHAWRYRNQVFDAFNRDMPFDEFIRLQIAGDLLRGGESDPRYAEGIIATGYLAIARRFGHDIDKDMYLTCEDVIDNLGKNFLGLTFGCARCHDHKYDPVTSRDYYALYGILSSSRFSFPGCEPKGQPRDMVPLLPAEQVEALMRPWRERSAKVEAEKRRRRELMAGSVQKIREAVAGSTRTLSKAAVGEGASVSLTEGLPDGLNVTVRRGEVLQLTVYPNEGHGADSTLIDWTIRESGGAQRTWSTSELVANLTEANPHAGSQDAVWCFLETTNGPAFLTERRLAINGRESLTAWSLGSEPSVFANSSDEAVPVWTSLPAKSFFVHPGPRRPVAVAWVSPIDGVISISGRVADAHPAGLDGVAFQLDHLAAPEAGPLLVEVGRLATEPGEEAGPEPAIPVAYAVVDAQPAHAREHLRGDPEKPGEVVPRRWLNVFAGESVPDDAGSGRRQLGDWIARHPLAARVLVNRVWQWHFGQGLVRTPNDFGARGERATHPELLDWLAAQFIARGHSLKALHRLIMHSAAYQRSSSIPAGAATIDPENRLLSYFPRRRLTAEEMRDSLLSVSGQLDPSPAEAHPFPPEATWTFTQHNPFNAVYETNRRSAYLMVQRQRRHPFLALFDGADPNASTPVRQTTTVPTQALYFLNDPFFHAQAGFIAASLQQQPDAAARIHLAYRLLFQRSPDSVEQERASSFLLDYPAAPDEQWAAWIRVLLASNEFQHLD